MKRLITQYVLWCMLWATPSIAAPWVLPQENKQDQNKPDQKDQKGEPDRKSQNQESPQKDQSGDSSSQSGESSSSSSSSSAAVPGLAEELKQPDATYNPLPAEQDVEVGTFYMHKGDLDAAIPRFEDAIRLRPNLAKPRLLLAEIYEKKSDKASAVKYYKEYLRVFPHAPDAAKVQKKIDKLTAH